MSHASHMSHMSHMSYASYASYCSDFLRLAAQRECVLPFRDGSGMMFLSFGESRVMRAERRFGVD